jgi:tRNA(fMet)-specific endonuclease VapC
VKKNQILSNKLRQVEIEGEDIFISAISYYEVKRGLLYVNATRQLSNFNAFCNRVNLLFVDDLKIVETAAIIHADLRGKGTTLEDADVLIAATAISHNLILVSHDSDMQRVPGLKLQDWLSA